MEGGEHVGRYSFLGKDPFLVVRGRTGVTTIEQAGVVITPGAVYGPAGEGWFRISLTTPDNRLVEAMQRLGALAK